nr:T9SS type A sorting domain-containing protein [Breznakibacter sp.]
GFNLGANAAGRYTINASNIGGFDVAYDVFLEDLPNGVTYNLREVGSVEVTLPAGVTNNRFVLRFKPSSNGVPTVLPEMKDEIESNGITISQLGNEAFVQILGEIEEQARIELYGLEGQLIRVKKDVSKSTKIQLPDVNAVYVVRVVNGNKIHSARVVSLGK